MEREGKKLKVLADGDPRRLADGRNAWRKMTHEQRVEFLMFAGLINIEGELRWFTAADVIARWEKENPIPHAEYIARQLVS